MSSANLLRRFQRWREQRRFAAQLRRVRDGISSDEVVSLLGPPDGTAIGDAESGVDVTWAYFERLSSHRIVQVAITRGRVAYSSLTTIPDDARRDAFRASFIPHIQLNDRNA